MHLLLGRGRPAALLTGEGEGHVLAQLQELVRAIEEKRTLKRQAKQEKREAIKNGEVEQPDWLGPPNEQLDAPT